MQVPCFFLFSLVLIFYIVFLVGYVEIGLLGASDVRKFFFMNVMSPTVTVDTWAGCRSIQQMLSVHDVLKC